MKRLALLIALLFPAFAAAEGLLVIAYPAIAADTISRDELAAVYLLQKTSWDGGLPVVPVNRELSSKVRDHFSMTVLNHTPQELAAYWNRMRFQGRQPPVVQTSDQAVIGFVHNVPGAIGYIDADRTPAGVKVLARLP